MPFINVNAIAHSCWVAIAAAALTAAPLLTCGGANADEDPVVPIDPQAECTSFDKGGEFSTTTSEDGVALSVCQYIVEGYFYYDNYANGVYAGTLVYKNGEKVPTERPIIDPLVSLPKGFPLAPLPNGF